MREQLEEQLGRNLCPNSPKLLSTGPAGGRQRPGLLSPNGGLSTNTFNKYFQHCLSKFFQNICNDITGADSTGVDGIGACVHSSRISTRSEKGRFFASLSVVW